METSLVLQITKDSFPPIMKLPNLQELTLVGCIGIDDDALGSLQKECSKSLQVLDLSHCQNITDVGVSSILKLVPNLFELDLSYCCPVSSQPSSCIIVSPGHNLSPRSLINLHPSCIRSPLLWCEASRRFLNCGP